jgi:hypothetical protein
MVATDFVAHGAIGLGRAHFCGASSAVRERGRGSFANSVLTALFVGGALPRSDRHYRFVIMTLR